MANTSSKIPDKVAQNANSKSAHKQAVTTVCERCGAAKVARSHSQNGEELLMWFLPKRPYRCLQCYHRFWKWESFFAKLARVWTWLVILLALALVVYLGVSAPNTPTVPFPSFGENEQGSKAQTSQTNNPDNSVSIPPKLSADTVVIKTAPIARPNSEGLSPEELEREVKIAEANSKLIQRENEQRKALLQERVLADMDEIRSLLKVDISYSLERWRHAWEAGQSDYYLSFYSSDFKPNNGLSYTQWRRQRQQRVDPAKNIDLTLTEFNVTFNSDNSESVVEFNQLYEAGSFTELSRKQLVLQKYQQEWKIISETEITE